VEKLCREFGLVPEDVDRYVAAFHDICKAKAYRYADFDAAFSNSVRQDWPKYRVGKHQTPAVKYDA
jgi:NADH:ubiquinone oxidoreductase subunit E